MADTGLDEIRILAPNGVIGSGFVEASFAEGLRRKPHFIGIDAGTTDAGPYCLGTGTAVFSADSIRADLRTILAGARRLNIPLLIGSCGTAGARGRSADRTERDVATLPPGPIGACGRAAFRQLFT